MLLELAGLALVLVAATFPINSYVLSAVVLIIIQASVTILIHCPAHYVVGTALGIRFSGFRLGRSTVTKNLPSSLKRLRSLLFVFILSVDAESKRSVPPRRMKAMYLSGFYASVGSAAAFALAVGLTGSNLAGLATWLFALGYLASDIVLSPRSGDVMRARTASTVQHPTSL